MPRLQSIEAANMNVMSSRKKTSRVRVSYEQTLWIAKTDLGQGQAAERNREGIA
jgi:hypothetical protein